MFHHFHVDQTFTFEKFSTPTIFLKQTTKVTHKYMLFTGREVRMGKNCARGLEYGPRPKAEGRTQDQGHSFFPIRTDLAR